MYERNAIVIDRYFSKKFGYQDSANISENFYNYCNLLDKIEDYQHKAEIAENSEKEFDEVLAHLTSIQQNQEKLYKRSAKLEYNRTLVFSNIEELPEELEKCLEKIESDISKMQVALNDIRVEFISTVASYQEKKKKLDNAIKDKQDAENEYQKCFKTTKENFEQIDIDIVDYIRSITTEEIRKIKKELIEVITTNGAKEKIPFDADVVSKASEFATDISKKEADCYVVIYDKTKKLIDEIECNSFKAERHKKWKKDNTAKLKFFTAEREYLIQFLDNERLPIMHGKKVHRKLMIESCKNLLLDVTQMNNLYELILREEASRSAKKAYKELYDKEYLKNIEEKEHQVEEEAAKLNLSTATVINSNYWRVEGIREIYTAFYEIITTIYGKELENFEEFNEEDAKEVTIAPEVDNVELELPQAKTIENLEEENEEEKEVAKNIESEVENFETSENDKAETEYLSNDDEEDDEEDESEDDENEDDLFDLESQIDELDDDMPYEEESEELDLNDLNLDDSLFGTVLKAKETGKNLKNALDAVKEVQNKKKKVGIFNKLMKMNEKNKRVEG